VNNQLPTPPLDMVMPQLANQVFTVANLAILAIFAVILGRECVRFRSPLPILFLLGGMLGVFSEPFFDLMVCAWYPQVDSGVSIVHAFNVEVPIWLVAPWGFYIGGQAYYVYRALVRGLHPTKLWLLLPIFWFTNVAFEIPGLLLGVYTYYGPQAFTVFGFPLWMGLSNAIMPITIAVVIYAIRPILVGYRVWLALPIVPLAGLAGGAFVGFPMWWALNSGAGSAATLPATFAVSAIACLLLYVYTSLACLPAGDTRSTATVPPVSAPTV
jgi:hypothetical protein